MEERTQDTRDARRGAPDPGSRRPYAAPQLTVHGSVEAVTQENPGRGRGRGHDKPKKHTKHPHQQP